MGEHRPSGASPYQFSAGLHNDKVPMSTERTSPEIAAAVASRCLSGVLRCSGKLIRVAAALAVGACYEYVPSHDPGSLIGKRVELALTDSGAVVLAGPIGPQVESVEGTLQGDSEGRYVVGVSSTRSRGGVETEWRGEQVVMPHALVASLAERRFSPTRSALAGGLAAIGIGTITAALRGAGRGGGGSEGGVVMSGK